MSDPFINPFITSVPERPIERTDLNILPGGQLAPQATDRRLFLEHQRGETRLSGVVQADDAADSTANDEDILSLCRLHGRSVDEKQAGSCLGNRAPRVATLDKQSES